LFNNALWQGSRAGRYVATINYNEKQAWIEDDGSNALWHTGSKWIFGSADDIGGGTGGIWADDDSDCPQNVASWTIYTGLDTSETAPSSDVSIGCFELAGNQGLQP
jgi:hypothetical protein